MTRSQRMYCNDILDRISRIEDYTASGRSAFMQSRVMQDATIHAFTIIGEAVKRLDMELTSAYPAVMWSDFAGFRDVLIHRYHAILLDQVWQYSQEDLPALKTAIAAILKDLEADD